MEERPIVFEVKEEEIEGMGFGDLVLFVASAVSFLSFEAHISADLDEEGKTKSIERMQKVDYLLSIAKERLNQHS